MLRQVYVIQIKNHAKNILNQEKFHHHGFEEKKSFFPRVQHKLRKAKGRRFKAHDGFCGWNGKI